MPEESDWPRLTDQEVVLLARAGQEAAYRELIRRYERPVFSEYFGNPPAEEFARLQNLTPDELEAEGKEWQENRKRRRGPYSTD